MTKPLALIVEDDRRLGDTLVDLLELLDLRCEYGANAAQARQQLSKLKPDLVLLDLPLYNRAGLDILTDIRVDLRLRDTKVIVITTQEYADIAELQLADAVLLKPFSFDSLEETIYELIEDLPSSDGGEFESFSSIHP
jgi:DNA-binding response OmpR family regulator